MLAAGRDCRAGRLARRWSSTILLLLTVLLAAFAVRSLSFVWSSLPYNIDGLSELRVTQDILSSGHLDFSSEASYTETYVPDMPILDLFAAYFSAYIGVSPVESIQLAASLLGSIGVLLVVAIFRSLWSSFRGALTTGILLALVGSFVFSTGCVWKETLGLVLIALALYSYFHRSQLPYRMVLLLSLMLLVYTHHHSTIVAFTILTFAIAINFAHKLKSFKLARGDVADLVTIAGVWALAASYYRFVDLPYVKYLSPQTDLYLFLAVSAVLILLGIKLSALNRPLTRTFPTGVLVPVAGAFIMLYNYYDPIFPGTPAPAALIAVPFLAYLVLTVPAWTGARLAFSKSDPAKDLILAMLLGPLAIILFAFLRGLDETSYTIIYRTFDFIMPAFAILIGLGFALIVKGREKLGAVAGAFLVVICASTLPVAYDTQELFGVQNHTYQFEYDSFEWLSRHGVDSYASDQRLSETGWRLFDINASRGLPYDLVENISLDKGKFYVLEEQWSTKGAQEFPFGVVVVDQDYVSSALESSSVVFTGGPPENQLVCFRK